MARLRAAQAARAHPDVALPPPAGVAPATTASAFDFSNLPRAQSLRIQQAAADLLGVSSPYFRRHDGPPAPNLVIDGDARLNFASYNYLGLNGHSEVLANARVAMERHGISASASRLVGGERPCHRALEEALARHYCVDDAISFVSGHATNVSTISTLLGHGDLVLTDQLAHNSIMEGARLAGAQRLVVPHNDLDWLNERLGAIREQYRHVLIAVEGLYSMDGDSPLLPRLVDIKRRHDAWLMVDEAHGLGVLGPTGRGIAEAQAVEPRSVDIWMGTLSKTLGACGGYVAGSAELIDLLRYHAPGFVYSVGLAPPLAAAAEKALEILHREPDRVARLQTNGRAFFDAARAAGLDTGLGQGTAVAPIVVGGSAQAVVASQLLYEAGISALPIIHPAVPERLARLRFFLTSEHDEAQIRRAVAAVAAILPDARRRVSEILG